jgi:hypothetical protein
MSLKNNLSMKSKNTKTGKITTNSNKATTNNEYTLWYIIILSVAFLLAYTHIFDKKMDLNGDNFGYLNFASSILNGKGYSSPYSPDYPATNWFPPGYSAILSLLMLFFGDNIILFKIVNGLFYLGGILLFFLLLKNVSKNVQLAFSVCFLIMLNSGLLRWATILMSEIPYLFFCILSLYCLSKMEDDVKIFKSKYFWGVLLSAVAAYYLRGVGIVLAGAIVFFWLLEKKWKRIGAFIGGYAILYLPWMIRNSLVGIKGRYLGAVLSVNNWRPEEGQINSVSGFLSKMLVNFYDTVLKGFTDVLFPFAHVDTLAKSTVIVLGGIILIVTLFGAWKTGKYRFLFISYILGNMLVFLLWHSGNGSRYVWPLMPFIAFCFFLGLYEVAVYIFHLFRKTVPEFLPYCFLILSFFMFLSLNEMHDFATQDYPPAYKNYFDMAKTIKKQGNRNWVVACRKADMFYYFSKTYVTMYTFSLDDREVIKGLVDSKVDFVVLDQLGYSSTYRYLYPAIMKNQELFQPVMHLLNPDTYLLYFQKDKAKKKFNL